MNILFIGNSYTYYNDMPASLFLPIAEAEGLSVEVTAVTKGGYDLSRFADPEDEEGKRLRRTVRGRRYDVVVLQDQSCDPIRDEERFLGGVRDLKALLGKQTKRFVLYATWGRKTGSPQLEELGMTSDEMTEALSAAYRKAGALYGMDVAEVGRAFVAYAKAHPDAELYNADLSHPSIVGSAVAAETIFGTVFGR